MIIHICDKCKKEFKNATDLTPVAIGQLFPIRKELCEDCCKELTKFINNNEQQKINEEHQKLNGELREELKELKTKYENTERELISRTEQLRELLKMKKVVIDFIKEDF